jgi:hypothetical protein
MVPAVSAGVLRITKRRKMTMTGLAARNTARPFMSPP